MVPKLTKIISGIEVEESGQSLLSDFRNGKGMLHVDIDEVETILNLPGSSYLVETSVDATEQVVVAVNNVVASIRTRCISCRRAKGLLVYLYLKTYPKASKLQYLVDAIDTHFGQLETTLLFNVFENNSLNSQISLRIILTGVVTN